MTGTATLTTTISETSAIDARPPADPPRQADQLTREFISTAEELITHYPVTKRSASLPLIHLWQNHFGYVDESGIEWIAAKLNLQPVNIYELVTFYPWFRRVAPGQHIIRVCRTLSCALAGSEGLYHRFCEAVGIDLEEARHHHGEGLPTSPDGKYSVEFVECLASCGTAPVCLVNDDLYENVAPDDVPEIIGRTEEESDKARPARN